MPTFWFRPPQETPMPSGDQTSGSAAGARSSSPRVTCREEPGSAPTCLTAVPMAAISRRWVPHTLVSSCIVIPMTPSAPAASAWPLRRPRASLAVGDPQAAGNADPVDRASQHEASGPEARLPDQDELVDAQVGGEEAAGSGL